MTAVHTNKITDSKVTQGDRVAHSMARLLADIGKFVGNKKNDANMNNLRQLAGITQQLGERNKSSTALPVKITRVLEVLSDVEVVECPKTR